MNRILLFSTLTEDNRNLIITQLFPSTLQNKVFSYMPSDGVKGAEDYIEQWRVIAYERGVEFNVIDNSIRYIEEQRKLASSDVLLISGGNTFSLLRNLRESGLDKLIIDFAKRADTVLAGFSAGALVMTPTINICNLPPFDENLVELKDLNGLHVVDFEVFPHYDERLHKADLENYRKIATNPVRDITDESFIVVDR